MCLCLLFVVCTDYSWDAILIMSFMPAHHSVDLSAHISLTPICRRATTAFHCLPIFMQNVETSWILDWLLGFSGWHRMHPSTIYRSHLKRIRNKPFIHTPSKQTNKQTNTMCATRFCVISCTAYCATFTFFVDKEECKNQARLVSLERFCAMIGISLATESVQLQWKQRPAIPS